MKHSPTLAVFLLGLWLGFCLGLQPCGVQATIPFFVRQILTTAIGIPTPL
jgi:hypothetical protein